MVAAVLGVILLCLAATTRGFSVANVSSENDEAGTIVGGRRVEIEQYPHQLFMSIRASARSGYICGAAIIGNSWALTAAHCCSMEDSNRPYQARQITLRSGSANRNSGGQEHSVVRVKVHERYASSAPYNDICLLKVASPFRYNSKTRSVALASSKAQYRAGAPTFAAGWGTTRENGRTSDTLLGVQIPLISDQQCQQQGIRFDPKIEFCAFKRGKDTCQGDSGGAVIAKDRTLLGVVSRGNGCATSPGIYTKVSAYRSWIRTNTGI